MADPPTTLALFIAELKKAPLAALPPHEEWTAHVARISVPGRIAEVTEDHYFYWLEVLPPHFQRGSQFCFAEGAEAFRFFWRFPKGRFYVRQLTWDETVLFCRLAHIPLPW